MFDLQFETDLKKAAEMILASRGDLRRFAAVERAKAAEEGGCGVTGFICSEQLPGKHIYRPSVQMHNRGNGKGGGIAALGMDPGDMGVSPEILRDDYILQVALLEPAVKKAVEEKYIKPHFVIHHSGVLPHLDDYRDVEGMEVNPPDISRYFARVRDDALDAFAAQKGLKNLPRHCIEDEFVYQNSVALNGEFYASLGDKAAFVMSHAKNLIILKIVGYAEQIVEYYQLQDFKAHGWIAHQRYPTKGRVWHPGGAHPFIGMHEALVHNGDFANYYSVSEYLKQRNIFPQFLTDTEVSVLLFDLLNRVYNYPLEYIIEALAPTTELDFDYLPADKQEIYRQIVRAHIHGSPDGPWFFIIARNDTRADQFQLMGITDTSMLRPQVFALQEGEIQVGLVCSEKQAIDATLHSLAADDTRFGTVADRYWNARGGSSSDGGAFIFTIPNASAPGPKELVCTDKFGSVIKTDPGRKHCDISIEIKSTPDGARKMRARIEELMGAGSASERLLAAMEWIGDWDFNTLRLFVRELITTGAEFHSDGTADRIIELMTGLIDRRFDTGDKRRRSVLQILRNGIKKLFRALPPISAPGDSKYRYINWDTRRMLRAPRDSEEALVVDAEGFPAEGEDCDATLEAGAYSLGWTRFICFAFRGQRFTACGLGPNTKGIRFDVYGSSGDYLASGIDGLEIHVHGNAQDQVGQIMKSGKAVFHGDVGQTFLYGAKGGEVYVLGNAAGRPMINAVGRPRVVINGTCLDYLAESFMAGDPLNGGGFAVVNGLKVCDNGAIETLDAPYPGSNLFSLASGGAIYIRDPREKVVPDQLNGGEFAPMTPADWSLILPYLRENERLFGISIDKHLLTVDGEQLDPDRVYRKVRAVKLAVLAAAEVEDDTE